MHHVKRYENAIRKEYPKRPEGKQVQVLAENENRLVVISGPTASGKSEIAVELARKIGGEIISADSMQVYRHMDIGSAKITLEEMMGVPHYMIDVAEPTENFDVARFAEEAKAHVRDIQMRGKVPILCGGTGFYIQAVLYDIDFSEEEQDQSLRRELEETAARIGKEAFHDLLKEVDPESAIAIPAGNVKRVVRALEYYRKNGKPISAHNLEQRQKESVYNSVYFVLTDEREKIYARIDQRVDEMIRNGLPEEVAALRERGCTKEMISMQGIGYRQILDWLDGECTLEEACERVKKETRHFAKRQLTWFRREKDVIWLEKKDFASPDALISHMTEILVQKGIWVPEQA